MPIFEVYVNNDIYSTIYIIGYKLIIYVCLWGLLERSAFLFLFSKSTYFVFGQSLQFNLSSFLLLRLVLGSNTDSSSSKVVVGGGVVISLIIIDKLEKKDPTRKREKVNKNVLKSPRKN